MYAASSLPSPFDLRSLPFILVTTNDLALATKQ